MTPNGVIDPICLLLNFLHLEMKLHWDEITVVVSSTASPTRCGLMPVAHRLLYIYVSLFYVIT